jgi:hypothetical protein
MNASLVTANMYGMQPHKGSIFGLLAGAIFAFLILVASTAPAFAHAGHGQHAGHFTSVGSALLSDQFAAVAQKNLGDQQAAGAQGPSIKVERQGLTLLSANLVWQATAPEALADGDHSCCIGHRGGCCSNSSCCAGAAILTADSLLMPLIVACSIRNMPSLALSSLGSTPLYRPPVNA